LAEGNPESVAIADDEFTHTVKRVMQVLDDFNFAVDVASQRIDVVNMRIEIDFASAGGAWAAAGIQHYIALSQSQQRPVDLAGIALAINVADFEAD
jgi:DNA segregation ATPase FtsK/SpoIIIE-like protein